MGSQRVRLGWEIFTSHVFSMQKLGGKKHVNKTKFKPAKSFHNPFCNAIPIMNVCLMNRHIFILYISFEVVQLTFLLITLTSFHVNYMYHQYLTWSSSMVYRVALYRCSSIVLQSLSHVWLFVTLWLQHARLPCPSLSPGVCSDSYPLSWWYYLTIWSSAALFCFCLLSFRVLSLFQWVGSSHQVAKVLDLQHQSFQWIFRVDFLYDWPVWSPCCPGDFQESSPAS